MNKNTARREGKNSRKLDSLRRTQSGTVRLEASLDCASIITQSTELRTACKQCIRTAVARLGCMMIPIVLYCTVQWSRRKATCHHSGDEKGQLISHNQVIEERIGPRSAPEAKHYNVTWRDRNIYIYAELEQTVVKSRVHRDSAECSRPCPRPIFPARALFNSPRDSGFLLCFSFPPSTGRRVFSQPYCSSRKQTNSHRWRASENDTSI